MKRVKKEKSKARRIIEWVLVGIVGVLFLAVGAGQIESMVHKDEYFSQPIRFGVGNFVVRTNSMEPEYKVNSAIITYREDPEKLYQAFLRGETIDITFMDRCTDTTEYTVPEDKSLYDRTIPTGYPMTHRVQEIHIDQSKASGQGRYTFIVAGINPEGKAAHPGQYQAFTERFILGKVVLHSDFLGAVFGFVASPWGLFVLLLIPAFYLVIVSVMDIFKAMKEPAEEVTAEAPKKDVSLEGLSEAELKRLKDEMLQEMLSKKAAPKPEEQPEEKQ
ncbi:MAG: hypothetical protein IJU64_06595 [Bacilli bacterium]|nr:hypothetical protein [Bacilli bacterium]